MKCFLLMTGCLMLTVMVIAQDHLALCYNKQAKMIQGQCLYISYKENSHTLVHGMEPWKQSNTLATGSVWYNSVLFIRKDTLQGSTPYYSTTQLEDSTLLLYNYGSKDLATVTRDALLDYTFETSRYSPVKLLNYFAAQAPKPAVESNDTIAVYKLTINKTIVQLLIDKRTDLLEKVITTYNDDMLGDITNTCLYRSYTKTSGLYFPGTITIEKVNGRLHDEITIASASLLSIPAMPIAKPATWQLKETTLATPVVTINKYNEHLYFIELRNTASQTAVVVFKDYLLVADVPLSSDNGELILKETRKLWPGKPVKYFAFGHHHPWSLGGVRPFVHNGTTILTTQEDIPYLQYLVTAPHTLQPDSLQWQPKALITEETGTEKTITDGDYTMKICFMGEKSAHTKDYLLFYFPEEKLLFEGDLTWIPRQGKLTPAIKRQAGLYSTIKELGLQVNTIVQHWPMGDGYGVKSVIPFSELEESISLKQ